MAFHVSGNAVGPPPSARPRRQDGRQTVGVRREQGVADRCLDALPDRAEAMVELGLVEAIVGLHARSPVSHELQLAQASEVRGHARLRQKRDGRELGDGQFLAFQQRQQTDPCRLGENLEGRGCVLKIDGLYPFIAIQRWKDTADAPSRQPQRPWRPPRNHSAGTIRDHA